MIVLLLIGALVVDLGFSWMLRRQEQNAADPGAVAAARWLQDANGNAVTPSTVQGTMNADACFYAQQNGIFNGDANCASALAGKQLQVTSPPISGPYVGRDGFVQVTITSSHPSFPRQDRRPLGRGGDDGCGRRQHGRQLELQFARRSEGHRLRGNVRR